MSVDDQIDIVLDIIVGMDPCELTPRLVLMLHNELNRDQEVYQALWGHLGSAQRSHFKAMLDRYRAIQVCK
jgi:hypothetical protein